MKLRHVISVKQFLDNKLLDTIFSLADEMAKKDKEKRLPNSLKGKILASVFYEPSTRTRFSFESAMLKLGGRVISSENAGQFSSATKGETLEDAIRIISGYSDVIVLRHPEEGAAKRASNVSSVAIINAGDGGNEHPTQALLDLYTIKKELGRAEGLHVAFGCDPLHSRTIRSLALLLTQYRGLRFTFISPKSLRISPRLLSTLRARGVHCEETTDLRKGTDADIVYLNRLQEERFSNAKEFEKYRKSYVLRKEMLHRKDILIMDPLPRVDEISPEVDSDPRAAYFRQAKNGLYIRMALLKLIFQN
ncbi:MAG: aspartate carbamoyltransferase [Candidatus Portnoybacteria bacterium]|nr:aspartate carbamoyltransferase [Candidatus Portnoybacteria bacterium]